MLKRTLLASAFLAVSIVSAYSADSTLRVCTGNPQLKYFKTANALAEQLRGVVSLDIKESQGSLDNLRKMSSGDCDAALVQSDSYLVYADTTPNASLKFEDVGPIYLEYAQLLCNRDSGVGKISDLKGRNDVKVAIGPAGGGTATTWYALTNKSPDYNKVNTVPLNAELALTRIIGGHDAQCLLVVSGLGTDFMKKADTLGKGKLQLVPFDDAAFGKITDGNNKPVYEYASIPGGTYYDLQYGTFSTAVSTIAVRAEFVILSSWYDANSAKYGDLSTAVLRMGQQQGGVH